MPQWAEFRTGNEVGVVLGEKPGHAGLITPLMSPPDGAEGSGGRRKTLGCPLPWFPDERLLQGLPVFRDWQPNSLSGSLSGPGQARTKFSWMRKTATRGRHDRTHRQGRGSDGHFARGTALRPKEPIGGGPASYPALRVPAGMCGRIPDRPRAPQRHLVVWDGEAGKIVLNQERTFQYLGSVTKGCSPRTWGAIRVPLTHMFPRSLSHDTPTASQNTLPVGSGASTQVSVPRGLRSLLPPKCH